MADRVVIVGSKRAGESIPPVEVVQMAGRCARAAGSDGTVEVIADAEDIPPLQEAFRSGVGLSVKSVMRGNDALLPHIVAEVGRGAVKSADELKAWFYRSLACAQGDRFSVDDIYNVLSVAFAVGVLEGDYDELHVTKIGEIANKLYFHPLDLTFWHAGFGEIFDRSLEDSDVAFCAFASRVAAAHSCSAPKEVSEEFENQARSMSLPCPWPSWGAVWHAALGGPRMPGMGAAIATLRADLNRYREAFLSLNKLAGWNKEAYFDDKMTRVKVGLDESVASFGRIMGVTKSMVAELLWLGVESETLINSRWDTIVDEGSPGLVKKLKEAGYGV